MSISYTHKAKAVSFIDCKEKFISEKCKKCVHLVECSTDEFNKTSIYNEYVYVDSGKIIIQCQDYEPINKNDHNKLWSKVKVCDTTGGYYYDDSNQ